MTSRPILVWFKCDLRLADNETLWQAAQTGQPVLPMVALDRRLFDEGPLGFSRWGSFRLQFWCETVAGLEARFRERGGNLLVRVGLPEVEIPAVVSKYNVSSVYTAAEVAPEEVNLLHAVSRAIATSGAALRTFCTRPLVHAQDIPWPIHRLPDVFTHFRKQVEAEVKFRQPVPIPELTLLPFHPENNLGSICEVAGAAGHPASVVNYGGGELNAGKRVNEYVWQKDLLKNYKHTRNGLLGTDYSTKLSPALALGAVSARTLYQEIKRYEDQRTANDSTYWLVFELLWRDYFYFMMKKYGAKVFGARGLRSKPVFWNTDRDAFERWRTGRTGVAFVDANMRELLLTGFMSNRGRQNVASFLTKDWGIDWRWGAAWFEHQLVDYDVCSNWLNWAYIAGVGNDPREDRYFNIESQAKRYDPSGHYVQRWLTGSR